MSRDVDAVADRVAGIVAEVAKFPREKIRWWHGLADYLDMGGEQMCALYNRMADAFGLDILQFGNVDWHTVGDVVRAAIAVQTAERGTRLIPVKTMAQIRDEALRPAPAPGPLSGRLAALAHEMRGLVDVRPQALAIIATVLDGMADDARMAEAWAKVVRDELGEFADRASELANYRAGAVRPPRDPGPRDPGPGGGARVVPIRRWPGDAGSAA